MEMEQWDDLDWATTVLSGRCEEIDACVIARNILHTIVRHGASSRLRRVAWVALEEGQKGLM
jgi:hypothetical protein